MNQLELLKRWYVSLCEVANCHGDEESFPYTFEQFSTSAIVQAGLGTIGEELKKIGVVWTE